MNTPLARSRRAGRALLAALLSLSLLTVGGQARADGPRAVVVLKDGERVEGTLVGQEPGTYVAIQTLQGQRRTFAWAFVREVVDGAASPPAVAPDGPRPSPGAPPSDRAGGGEARPVEVRFDSKRNKSLKVSVGSQSCTTPCSLLLAPGSQVVTSDRMRQTIDITSAGTVKIDTVCTGCAVLIGVGGVGLGVFALVGLAGATRDCVGGLEEDRRACENSRSRQKNVGLIGSLVTLPIAVIGLATRGHDGMEYQPSGTAWRKPSLPVDLGLNVAPDRGVLSARLSF